MHISHNPINHIHKKRRGALATPLLPYTSSILCLPVNLTEVNGDNSGFFALKSKTFPIPELR